MDQWFCQEMLSQIHDTKQMANENKTNMAQILQIIQKNILKRKTTN